MSAIRRCAWELKPVEVRIASKLLPKASVPESFRVRRVYLVGQNYNKHALEMGAARADPFFFAKPADTLIPEAKVMPYPPRTSDYHHEVELVIALGNPLNPFGEPEEYVNLTPEAAYKAVYGVGVGLDMTRRDLQAIAKKAGRPWDLSKGPDAGAPMSPITPLVEYAATRLKVSAEKAAELIEKDPATVYKQIFEGSIELLKNGKKTQSGNLNEMVWKVNEIVSYLSQFVALKPGDIIFTGTPEGVAKVEGGDKLSATIEGLDTFNIVVGDVPSKL